MKFTFFTILIISMAAIAVQCEVRIGRGKVFHSVVDWIATGGRCKGCTRRCLQDTAAIDGYCCGCARVTDYLPVDCYAISPNCPADGRKLCKAYDYMMDCCCP